MLDRWVAVKEIRIDELAGESGRVQRERSLREARVTARIDHPHVVRVYDVAEEGDRLWIVMQLVQAPSLEHVLSEGRRLDPAEAARVGRGLAAALREVHAVGVLHRDIKPGNVLIDARGAVVLTDFGIAAMQDAAALTIAGVLVGSPDYMAPERVEGREQGPPSDLWSLGATLCAGLAGESPFTRASTLATLHAVLYEEPAIPAEAGPLTGVLTALLRKEPRERPTVEEVDAALAPFAAPAPAPARPTDTSYGYRTPTVIDPKAVEPGASAAAPGAAEPEDAVPAAPQPESAPSDAAESQAAPSDAAEWEGRPSGVPASDADASLPEVRAPSAPETGPPAPDTPSPEAPSLDTPVLRAPTPRAAAQETSAPEPAQATGTGAGHGTRTGNGRRRKRSALVAAGAVLASVVAVVVVLVTAQGSEHGGSGGEPGARVSESPTAERTPGTRPAPAAPRRAEDGFSWVPPAGWNRTEESPREITYSTRNGAVQLGARQSPSDGGDLLARWRAYADEQRGRVPGYRTLKLERTVFRGDPAVEWEYAYTQAGRPYHGRQLGFRHQGRLYQLSIWYRDSAAAMAVDTYERVRSSFRTS